jgi:hypothetical protein
MTGMSFGQARGIEQADTDRRIISYLDGKNSSAALTITDEEIALSLVLGLVKSETA